MNPSLQRVIGVLVLVVSGIFSLPLSAAVLDGQGTEIWIIPAQLIAMSLVGVVTVMALPALARAEASVGRRALTGVWCGLMAAAVGVLVFWFLLNGFSGA